MLPVRNKMSAFFREVTVEPGYLLYYVTAAVGSYASSNLLLQKACHPGMDTAPDYNIPCQDEAKAQQTIAEMGSWRPFIEYSLPAVCIVFLGRWSDTHGKRRKPLLIIPACGEFIASVLAVLFSYFFIVSPQVAAAVLSLVRGATGGGIVMALGSMVYISDITDLEDRSWRLGVIISLSLIGSPIGSAIAGVLRQQLGFSLLFILCSILNVVSIILFFALMSNRAEVASKLRTFEGVCDPSALFESFQTLIKKRPGYNRLLLWLSGFVAPLFVTSIYGESAVLMLFARRKFGMMEIEFGLYSAYKLVTIAVGTTVGVLICNKVLKLSDEVIGYLGTITQMIANVAMCFVAYNWQLYVFPLIDFMFGATCTAGRSISTKVVQGDELGQVSSFFGVMGALVPLLVVPLYSKVYLSTVDFLPGAFFLLNVFFAAITFCLFIAMAIAIKRKAPLDEQDP